MTGVYDPNPYMVENRFLVYVQDPWYCLVINLDEIKTIGKFVSTW